MSERNPNNDPRKEEQNARAHVIERENYAAKDGKALEADEVRELDEKSVEESLEEAKTRATIEGPVKPA